MVRVEESIAPFQRLEVSRVRFRTGLVWLGSQSFGGTGTYQLYDVMAEKSAWSMRSFLGRLSYEDVPVSVDDEPATLRVLVHGRTFHGGALVDAREIFGDDLLRE